MDDHSRRTRVLAAVLFAVAVAGLATAVVIALVAGISWADAVGSFMVTNGAMGLGFAVSGVLLAWHRPGNPVGWLFLAAGVADATSAATVLLTAFGAEQGWGSGALGVLASVFTLSWPLAIGLCLPVALLLFPTGRPPSPRWRWLLWAATVEGALFTLTFAAPGSTTFAGRVIRPELTLPYYHQLAPLWAAGSLGYSVIMALAVASLAVRYRRAGDTERRQLLWLVLACVVVFAYAGLWWGLAGTGPILGLLVIPLIPAAVTVAILRYQLLDIRLVLSRTLAYAIVSGVLVGVYAGLVLLATQALPFSGAVGVAASTLACAALFAPLRRRTQRIVDRRFNRARYDTDQAIAAFAGRLRDAVDLDAVSGDLAAAVQAALEPAHLSVWVSDRPS
jgi:hypothetical protein